MTGGQAIERKEGRNQQMFSPEERRSTSNKAEKRGAESKGLNDREFPEVGVFRLERKSRSTALLLRAAYHTPPERGMKGLFLRRFSAKV